MTVVGSGDLHGAWRHFAAFPFLAGALGAVVTIASWAGEEGSWRDDLGGSLFVVFLFFALGSIASASILIPWLVLPARVTYVVDGTLLIAYRGKRRVEAADVRVAESVKVVGYMSTRRFYVTLRPIYSPLSNLPQVVCTIRNDRDQPLDVRFPRLLLWGWQEAAAFRARLESELSAAGIDKSVLSLDQEF